MDSGLHWAGLLDFKTRLFGPQDCTFELPDWTFGLKDWTFGLQDWTLNWLDLEMSFFLVFHGFVVDFYEKIGRNFHVFNKV